MSAIMIDPSSSSLWPLSAHVPAIQRGYTVYGQLFSILRSSSVRCFSILRGAPRTPLPQNTAHHIHTERQDGQKQLSIKSEWLVARTDEEYQAEYECI